MEEQGPARGGGGHPRARRPVIARSCFHLNWIFLLLWIVYLSGPDALGLFAWSRTSGTYHLFAGTFFVSHFILVATAIIALFVVIIEVYSRRPVRGLRSVVVALALPIVSFLYFALRFLEEVQVRLNG